MYVKFIRSRVTKYVNKLLRKCIKLKKNLTIVRHHDSTRIFKQFLH